MLNKRELKEIKERFESQKVIEDSQVDALESAQTALALVDMLKRLERVYDSQFNEYFCPICKAGEEVGHFEGCELAALLKGLEAGE